MSLRRRATELLQAVQRALYELDGGASSPLPLPPTPAPTTDRDLFSALLRRADIQTEPGRAAYADDGWTTVDFSIEAGLAGSPTQRVTAHFRPDGSLSHFAACD